MTCCSGGRSSDGKVCKRASVVRYFAQPYHGAYNRSAMPTESNPLTYPAEREEILLPGDVPQDDGADAGYRVVPQQTPARPDELETTPR